MRQLKNEYSRNKMQQPFPIILAIHAREWISGATCTYVVNELLNSQDAEVVKMTEDFDWYIICVANPDGYVFTHTNNRMWRKTRSTTSSPLGCRGADPNRNWGYMWNTGGSSNAPCDDTFHGEAAFSEVETKGKEFDSKL